MSERKGLVDRLIGGTIERKAEEIVKKKFSQMTTEEKSTTLATWFGVTVAEIDELGTNSQGNLSKYMQQYEDSVWVYACVYAIASDIAGLPLRIFKKSVKDEKVIKTDIYEHPMMTMLNKYHDLKRDEYEFREALVCNAELAGIFYIFLDALSGKGIPTNMFVMNSGRVEIVKGKAGVEKYKHHVNNEIIDVAPSSILSGRYFSPIDEFYGQGSVSASRMAIIGDDKANKYNAAFFRNGAKSGGYFETDKSLGGAEYNRLQAQVIENYSGLKNAFKPYLLEKGLKHKEADTTRKDMEFTEGKKSNREEILACFGVPPARVGILEYANYANMKEQMTGYWRDTIIPKLCHLLPVYRRMLALWGDSNVDCEFNLSGVSALQIDTQAQALTIKEYWNMGIPMNVLIDKFNLPFEKRIEWNVGYLPINIMAVGSAPVPEGTAPPKSAKELVEQEKKQKDYELECKRLSNILKRDESTAKRMDAHLKTIDADEKLGIKFLKEYFTKQQTIVMDNFNSHKSLKLIEDVNEPGSYKVCERIKDDKGKTEKLIMTIEDILFDKSKEMARFRKGNLPLLREYIKTGAAIESQRLGVSFNLENPRVYEYLKKYGLSEAKGITDTTIDKLRATLIEGMQAGETMPELSTRIQTTYDWCTSDRATMIARTEVISANNFGAIELYKQSDVVEGWEWFASPEACEECLLMDGSEHSLDEMFEAVHPHERCSTLAILIQ